MLSYNHKNEASLYIHIPFCKSACAYCNFSFSTILKYKNQVLDCIIKELCQKSTILPNHIISTIYLGGGTPSLLQENEIAMIINAIFKNYKIKLDVEITIEANPDDLTKDKLRFVKKVGVNRLSIGVQSFFDEDLRFMNRLHNSYQAIDSIINAQDVGFKNINVDLIYGYPLLSEHKFKKNISIVKDLDVSHLSTYSLTIENKTLFWHLAYKRGQKITSENAFAKHFDILNNNLSDRFTHYEISNWAKDDSFISKHNYAYWTLKSYIGIGPSAHSFFNNTRNWNTNNNHNYIQRVNKHLSPTIGSETLSPSDIHNEYIMLSLRTKWGINYERFKELFGQERLKDLKLISKRFAQNGLMYEENNHLKLNYNGLKISDTIISTLFI